MAKTQDLIGPALDWAVASVEYQDGRKIAPLFGHSVGVETAPGEGVQFKFWPSTDWSQGGPIIERERIETYHSPALECWAAKCEGWLRYGPTALIAAMRCFVASKLGDEIDVPDEIAPQGVSQ